tara:strand:+ start:140 stop:511 length:372 start_codon:yes stop_codon:yes gene_type:complete
MIKKLKCHCEKVELEINLPEEGFKKLMRCNCSLCKRKGAVMSPVEKEKVKILKGQENLKIYQYHTKVAEHYFCSICGIYTHHIMRSNPKMAGINVACLEGVNPFELGDIPVNDGINHPLDQKK